jgi:RNA polymerase sigma factor (sigma-70 family)
VTELAPIEDLYRRHGAMVLRRARRILGDEEAARDAMQEVFVKVMRERESFRGDASPVTWLYKVTTNLCLNKIRDAGRQRQLLAENAPVREEASGGAAPEDRAAVAKLIASLPDDLREIAVYYYVDEMNQDEIAEITGVSRRTIGNRLEAFRTAALGILGEPPARRTAR